jgi:hypothetical protein
VTIQTPGASSTWHKEAKSELLNDFTSLLVIADSGVVVGWTITALLALLLIGLPTLYLLVASLATDDDAFDRRVRDVEHYRKLSEKAHAYAWGKDVYNVLEEPLALSPLADTNAAPAPPEPAPVEANAA